MIHNALIACAACVVESELNSRAFYKIVTRCGGGGGHFLVVGWGSISSIFKIVTGSVKIKEI